MKPLLVSLALAVVLTPTFAFPVERDGTTLVFSFEELREMLRHPSPQQFIPPLSLQFQNNEGQDARIEREYRWGDGFGTNRSACPDSLRRPLWGY
jgi:hypothetical protein